VCHSKEETMVLSLTQISDSNFNNTKMMYLNYINIYTYVLLIGVKFNALFLFRRGVKTKKNPAIMG
ncbi:hypothetical protein BpHYR1_016915, partial [Brachionus plicatilis]